MKTGMVILLWAGSVLAQVNHNGGLAGAFLRVGLGGRSMAMGNVGVAMPAGAYAFYGNPALTAVDNRRVAALMGHFMALDRYAYFAGFTTPIPGGAGVSAAWLSSGTGNLHAYNTIGEDTGELNHSMHALYGTFARSFGKFRVGVSIKMVLEYLNDGTSEFDYAAQAVGGDAGIYYAWNEDLAFGVAVDNIGVQLKANTEKIFTRGGNTQFSLPLMIKAGAFYRTPLRWLRVAYETVSSNGVHFDHRMGMEALYGENIALRLGHTGHNFTFGAGMDFKFMDLVSYLDYVYSASVVDEGAGHLFSWQFFF